MNRVDLIGRLTKDVELYKTSTGKSNCRFTLAVDRMRSADGTRAADFIKCVAWNQTAELCSKYLHKGDRVGVEGRIQTGSYQKDGQTVYTTDVVVDRIHFLTPKGKQAAQEPEPTGNVTADGFAEVLDDQLPFE